MLMLAMPLLIVEIQCVGFSGVGFRTTLVFNNDYDLDININTELIMYADDTTIVTRRLDCNKN